MQKEAPPGQANKIPIRVKTVSFEKVHEFNVHERISAVIKFAEKDSDFGLDRHAQIQYTAYYIDGNTKRELSKDHTISDERIPANGCILISPPDNPYG